MKNLPAGFKVEYASFTGKIFTQIVCAKCFQDPIFRTTVVVETFRDDHEKNVECSDCGFMIVEH